MQHVIPRPILLLKYYVRIRTVYAKRIKLEQSYGRQLNGLVRMSLKG